jgi:predicted dehydrogenase
MPDRIRIAFLGVTHPHAASQVRTLQLVDEVESIVLCDEDATAAASLRAKCPDKIEETPLSLEQVIRREDVKFVWGCFRTDRNGPAVLRALQAGKHVMSEKPMGISASVIEEIVRMARANGLTLSVCYQNRYHPVTQDMRRYLQEGAIGQVMNAEVRMVTSQVKFRNPKHWLFRQEAAGGGILSWLMCHYFDLLRYLLRDEVVEVSAVTGTLNGQDIDVEDTASGALRFRSGVIAAFNAGYLLSMSTGGFIQPSYDIYVGIRGRDGSLTWEAEANRPRLRVQSVLAHWNRSVPVRTVEYSMDHGEGYGGNHGIEFVRQFIRAALHGEEAPTTGEDALKVAHIVEACYRSSQTGQRVLL